MNLFEYRKLFQYKLESIDDIVETSLYKLIDESEVFWKLLKYNSPDALSKDNLTPSEKVKLIQDKDVKLDSSKEPLKLVPFLSGQVLKHETTEVRIYPWDTMFYNDTYVTQEIRIEIITHYNNYLVDGGYRVELMKREIIKALNNLNYDDVDGIIGSMTFNNNTGRVQYYGESYIGCKLVFEGDVKWFIVTTMVRNITLAINQHVLMENLY